MLTGIRTSLARLIAPKPSPMSRRGFEGAAGGRRWPGTPSFGAMSTETARAAPYLRSRARHFAANNPWASNGVGALVAGLVGTGITPASAHDDAETRATIDKAIGRWARHADADGRTDYYGLQAIVARALVIDGESFVQLIARPDGLRLRVLPAEMVDESDTRDLPGGGFVFSGVEFNAAGERVAYRVLRHHPSTPWAASRDTVRIDAADMIHVCAPLGAGQVRGVSWLAPILLRLGELDQTEDALIMGVKIAAMHAGFITNPNAGPGEATDFDATDLSLEPGTIRRLAAGEEINFSTPQQAQQTAELIGHQVRSIAAGLGVPAHLVSGDLREANYGSLRAGLVAYRQRLEQAQFGTLIPQMAAPVFARAVASLVLSGRIDAPDFETDAEHYQAAEHYPPPVPWIDPAKDIAALREAVDMGVMSRRQAVAERGYSIEVLDAEIAADRERERKLGLSFAAKTPVIEGSAANADA